MADGTSEIRGEGGRKIKRCNRYEMDSKQKTSKIAETTLGSISDTRQTKDVKTWGIA